MKKSVFYKVPCSDIMLVKGVVFNMKDSKMRSRIGDKYEKLEILDLEEDTYPSGKRYYKYRCKCDCGKEVSIFVHNWKKSKSCGKCIPDSKIKNSPKGIVYHGKYDSYQVRVGKNRKMYDIGMFKDFDIALQVQEEALRHFDNLEYWIDHNRESYILSVCPEYKFRHKKAGGSATEQQKKLFAERNTRMLTAKMKEALAHLENGALYLEEKRWRDGEWDCTIQTLNSLFNRGLVTFNEDKTECYLSKDADLKLEAMKNAHRGRGRGRKSAGK